MRRRSFIRGILGAGAAMLCPNARSEIEESTTKKDKSFNVLFITADDLNGNSAGWMGNPHKLTPCLDAFAATSHCFVNNHSSASICQPSRQAMMTGLVPHRSGGLGFNPIHEETPTLVTVFKEHGYLTAGMNKLSHMEPASCFPWDLRSDHENKLPDKLHARVSSIIQAAKEADKPFFINCNIGFPHRPFYGSKDELRKEGKNATYLKEPLTADQVSIPDFLENLPAIREEVAQYYNSVSMTDVCFGQIINALENSGEKDRTVIIFASDHGMAFPFAKCTTYYNGTHSPAIVHFPKQTQQRVYQELTSGIDFAPTLLDIFGFTKPSMDGVSWLPLIQGDKQPNRDHVFTHVNSNSTGRQVPARSVITKSRSLVACLWSDGSSQFRAESMQGLTYEAMVEAAQTNPNIKSRLDQYTLGIPLALYDLDKDPSQRQNLINNPDYLEEASVLKQKLLDYMERTKDPQIDNYKRVLLNQTVENSVEKSKSRKRKRSD